MKKVKLLVAFASLSILLLVLAACGNDRVEPKKAAEQTVEAMLYGKNTDNMEKIYGKSNGDFDTEFEKSFIDGFKSQSGATGEEADKEIRKFYKAFQKRNREVTSFTTKVTDNDKEKPVVEIKAKGLNMKDVATNLQKAVMKEAQKDPSIATDRVKIIKLYTNEIKKAKAVDTPATVEMKFEVNKDNKKWKIANQNDFIQQIGTAFVAGGI
ncbi:Uncharacterised protein [Listeria grayi]|uniref:DUF5105 domain-containing protein n=3 Tax=Listeria grayi TaxID=1641 RepID=D7UX10_LISGR|nr:DUF5105 domain-containing protein [Listeria grayi]EFI84218.1 hypothetical protein HMPREF0556_10771 [Listeria grayi DSM 20601]EUJ30594.1 hypothetical protein LMUR_00485 [Listeria grayi FSL F6-1183]MBC1921791.1 DUF5105 domain-containing protein [Listeria grayi]STY45253.1 Uncharacterised protein [Listeria grayi]VEI31899.1 Uncharacterised protein [Listeria grayi]